MWFVEVVRAWVRARMGGRAVEVSARKPGPVLQLFIDRTPSLSVPWPSSAMIGAAALQPAPAVPARPPSTRGGGAALTSWSCSRNMPGVSSTFLSASAGPPEWRMPFRSSSSRMPTSPTTYTCARWPQGWGRVGGGGGGRGREWRAHQEPAPPWPLGGGRQAPALQAGRRPAPHPSLPACLHPASTLLAFLSLGNLMDSR